ncbi:betaine/proline/choline family ABC transporter ATP-binding protein [Sedimentibacter sp.]|uniref:betaine/proline/choline family ABC transporter ATP-binding protein n=1 Tax=Sedimentibacter sp. TaxID=1960295 RepID=UPI000EDFEB65|nr:betaine/proline/choline family ABC transporter ATP-binding protein [Sedimentibacter sp.]HCX63080.1 glycine betaine ABC transporter ATP-binding protein [Clostridiales bacterium]
MIKFENVTKKYPNTKNSAVNNLNLEINEGEICMLVGPSGCGKTTTMKMVNRLIEPTSGNIYIDGENIMAHNPVDLRRNIGYVIQNIGLFPHMTIAENIATVPREKKWDKERIDKRVDELLELMELNPEIYRNRRPSDLSGGQRQRVGVARALAADPPVMLMDEPFGALDPITRSKLQNEFLRLQEKIRKTIIFVTHDIDEAIKMGDKIVVVKNGKIVQQGTPDDILSNPADEFVENLIGGNRSIKRLNLVTCSEIMHDTFSVKMDTPLDTARTIMLENGLKTIALTGQNNKLLGYAELKDIEGKTGVSGDYKKEMEVTVDERMSLNDALSEMLRIGQRYIYVADERDNLKGWIGINDILNAVSIND